MDNVTRAASSDEAIKVMQAPTFDPLTMAVVEGDSDLRASGSPGTVSVTSYSQQYVELEVEAQQPCLLVLTDTFYPGWTAAVDGSTAQILPTDVAFRGVVVPAGTHQVTFHFAPTSFRIGIAMAAIALVLLGLTLWRLRVPSRAGSQTAATAARSRRAEAEPARRSPQ